MQSHPAVEQADADPGNALVVARKLSPESLKRLVHGELHVVWHEKFHPPSLCEEALPNVTAACRDASYTLTSDLDSVGTSVGEAAESERNAERYYATAADTTKLIREEVFHHRPSPLDRVRVLIDEYWPHGAVVGHFDGRTMLPGIVRRWASGGHANPHIDSREGGALRHLRLKRRIGVNIYLEVPPAEAGGDLDFWYRIEDEDAYARMKRPDYGLDRNLLGPPLLRVRPSQGDMVMFDAAIVHGVNRVDRGERATAACFVGYSSDCEPLVIFA